VGEEAVSGAISDGAVVAVLRPFVRATRPVLDRLRESDPFGLRGRALHKGGDERGLRAKMLDSLASVHVPGTAAWAAMDVDQRSRWWVRRVGRLTSLVAAVPGFGGFVTSRLPISATLGAAAQGLVLCAIAGEHGVRDEVDQIALLGEVLFGRTLRPERAAGAADVEADARAAELTGDLSEPGAKPTVARIGSALWRLGRALFALQGELDKRPHGRFYHRWIGNLPVVGAAGKYFGEWSGLQRAAEEGMRRLRRP
jgi:hypothetical protein